MCIACFIPKHSHYGHSPAGQLFFECAIAFLVIVAAGGSWSALPIACVLAEIGFAFSLHSFREKQMPVAYIF